MAVIALIMLLFISPVKNILSLADQNKTGCVLTADQVHPTTSDLGNQVIYAKATQNTAVIKNHQLLNYQQSNKQDINTGNIKKEVELVSKVETAGFLFSHYQIAYMKLKFIPTLGKRSYFQPGGL